MRTAQRYHASPSVSRVPKALSKGVQLVALYPDPCSQYARSSCRFIVFLWLCQYSGEALVKPCIIHTVSTTCDQWERTNRIGFSEHACILALK